MKKSLMTILLLSVVAFAGWTQDKMMSAEPMMMSSGTKVDFTTLEDAQMLAAENQTVLFFYASWCPFCRKDLAEIDAKIGDLGNIAVVVVNYDKETELRKMYGVTYQHTYVQIDEDGMKVALWSGGGVDGILENVTQEPAMSGGMN